MLWRVEDRNGYECELCGGKIKYNEWYYSFGEHDLPIHHECAKNEGCMVENICEHCDELIPDYLDQDDGLCDECREEEDDEDE